MTNFFSMVFRVSFVILLFLLVNTRIMASNEYSLRVDNLSLLPDGKTLTFEIKYKNTSSAAQQIATWEFHFNFNKDVLNGGTGSYSILDGVTPISMRPRNPTINITPSSGELFLASNAVPGAGNGLYIAVNQEVVVVKMQLSSTTLFPQVLLGLSWRNTPVSFYTNIRHYVGTVNTLVTNPLFHEQINDISLPVELASFFASTTNRDVNLIWETKTEVNSKAFEIERASFSTSPIQEWNIIGSILANGTTTSPHNYSFIDKKLQSGKYIYRLKMIDNDGTFKYSAIVEAEVTLPKEYALSQNYPNPFNPTTRIDYQLPFDSKVTLELYGITGEKVATLINSELSAGYYTADVNASAMNLASGVYIYRMTVQNPNEQNFVQVKKLILSK